MLQSPAFWEWHFREPQSHGVVVTPWYDMKCSLMSNVNMPVPPARGRSSLGLSAGMWWHFNGLFIPQNAFSHSRKKTHKKNQDRSTEFGGWKKWRSSVFTVTSAAVERRGKVWSSLCDPRGVVTGTYLHMNQGDMTESPPNGKNVMNYTRTANEAERQKGDEK